MSNKRNEISAGITIIAIIAIIIFVLNVVGGGKLSGGDNTWAERISTQMNRDLPKRVNKYMVLKKAMPLKNMLTLEYEIANYIPPELRADEAHKRMAMQMLTNHFCNTNIRTALEDGLVVELRTRKKSGELEPSVFFSKSDCF